MDIDQSPEQKGELPSREISLKEKETNNVGEVRRKVQEMTWKEGQGQGPPPSAEQEDGKDLKRKTLERNESSTLEPNTSPKKAKETPSVRPSYSSCRQRD